MYTENQLVIKLKFKHIFNFLFIFGTKNQFWQRIWKFTNVEQRQQI